MGISQNFADYIIDQLQPLGNVTIRKMFGGGGIYCEGIIFGLLADDVLYFKADDFNRSDSIISYWPSFVRGLLFFRRLLR